jgi:hypothetical protein
MGTRCHIWLRRHATSRKVAGSIPVVIEFFNLRNISSRMAFLFIFAPKIIISSSKAGQKLMSPTQFQSFMIFLDHPRA